MDVLGLPIPDAGPLFRIALALHIAAGLTCAVAGAVAALSRKGGRRRLRFGRIYIWGLGVVFVTMTAMSMIRWRENAHLFAIGCLSFASGLTGYLGREKRLTVHIVGMGVSYIGLLTAFYVDNGPHLPLWDRLPPIAFWLLPSLIGVPLIARSVNRRRRRPAGPEPRRA
ncbi:hypothetical protein [Microtetraspora malaysiensis]|uniref:hypothetical protein n=1 Tax=Microtetraspora malaysiensis TaxID=161358 RepID=UPI0008339539|nr:hypothetical protein [Microtetraspora malaysiensis]